MRHTHRAEVYEVQAAILVVYQRCVLATAAAVVQYDVARALILAQHVVGRAVNGDGLLLPTAAVHLRGQHALTSAR